MCRSSTRGCSRLHGAAWRAQHLHGADGAGMLRTVQKPRERFGIGLRTLASGGEVLGEEVFLGSAGTGPDNQRILWPDRVQSHCGLLCRGRGVASGLDRQACARPLRSRSSARDGSLCEPKNSGRSPPCGRTRQCSSNLGAARGDGGQIRRGLDENRRSGPDGRGWVYPFRRARRRCDHLGGLSHRAGRNRSCLISHPAVAIAAAVGKPDPLRTEIVKAFIVLKPGFAASEPLRNDIQAYVRTRLSAHEYPREIEFVDELPLTTAGKITAGCCATGPDQRFRRE